MCQTSSCVLCHVYSRLNARTMVSRLYSRSGFFIHAPALWLSIISYGMFKHITTHPMILCPLTCPIVHSMYNMSTSMKQCVAHVNAHLVNLVISKQHRAVIVNASRIFSTHPRAAHVSANLIFSTQPRYVHVNATLIMTKHHCAFGVNIFYNC